MKVNVNRVVVTHQGGKAVEVNAYERLKRTVMACMLFEDNFYEDGVKAADRIKELCGKCSALQICALALDAAQKYHLRHIPLQMLVEAFKKPDKFTWFSDTIYNIITRPDMMTDLLALYWKEKKIPLANQLKRGLAKAFGKFDEYQLSKYDRDNPIKLRDVLFLCHAKPKDDAQADLWKRLVNKQLKTADTWETRLSAGEDKKESFQELLQAKKMGKLAILRNIRNMQQAGITKELVASELMRNMKEMLPFQYIAAARECPQWEDIIDPAMVASCALKPKLHGKTFVFVDVSGSMDHVMSSKSVMTRMDAACAMAILLKECCTELEVYSFSDKLMPIPPRHGMALRDAIVKSQQHGGTYLGAAINHILKSGAKYDRIIIITDEQSADNVPRMPMGQNYILNIAGYQNGIGNKNEWTTITGFSEASIDFIREYEESTEKK
jgi:60 kDa SS-A/Ro ribonucleoprotein